jgi:hypothetical protein
MARNKKPPREPLSNVAARHACITDGFARRFALDQQIAELEAEHIKPLRDDRSKAWKNVAADTGLAVTDLTDQYRIYKRQQLAKAFADDADRDTVLDAQREIFAALQAGQTLDFLTVLDRVADKPKREGVFKGAAAKADAPPATSPSAASSAAEPAPAENMDLSAEDPVTSSLLVGKRSLGQAAFGKGHTFDRNPHRDQGNPDERAWDAGWWIGEGAKAYRDGKKVMECRHSTGTPAWRAWNHGWNQAAKRDGKDAETVGAMATAGTA